MLDCAPWDPFGGSIQEAIPVSAKKRPNLMWLATERVRGVLAKVQKLHPLRLGEMTPASDPKQFKRQLGASGCLWTRKSESYTIKMHTSRNDRPFGCRGATAQVLKYGQYQ